MLFCLNCSILCSYLFTFVLFASILCFSSSITVFNPFLTLYFSYSSFTFCFFFDLNSPFKSTVSKFTFSASFFISPSILCFHLGSFFFPIVSFLQSYLLFYPHTYIFNQIIGFFYVFAFKTLNRINSICLNL